VTDYVAGKAAWLAAGLPVEGSLGERQRVGWLVTDGGFGASDVELVLTSDGLLDAVGDDLDPVTVRPSLPSRELLDRWRSGSLSADLVVVTTAAGHPVGALRRSTLLDLARRDQLP
jgi:hypothetical protein